MWWLLLAFQASAFATPSPPLVADPWTPPTALVESVRRLIPAEAPALLRLRLLHRHLVSPRGLGIRRASSWSGSSLEVLRAKRADCVGFAYLYVGLARPLGLDVGFAVSRAGAGDRARAARLEGLAVREAHIGATFTDRRGDLWTIDQAGVRRALRPSPLELDDQEAAGLLLSNRIVRALERGDCDAALRYEAWGGGHLPNIAGNLPRVLGRFCLGEKPAFWEN